MAKKKSKPMFHKPQVTSKPQPIPTTMAVKVLSVAVIVVLVALTAFAIYVATQKSGFAFTLTEGLTMKAELVFLFLPIVGWVIVIGFRLALRLIPLDMWRLPATVKEAAKNSQGKYLKIATLLIQLVTVLAFCYITIMLYNGLIPNDIPIIIWVLAVVAIAILMGKRDIDEYRK